MTTTAISSLLDTVSEKVLSTIKNMSDKQLNNKLICLDTISLVLRISIKDLKPIIEYLQSEGHIIIHPNLSEKTRGAKKPDCVSLN